MMMMILFYDGLIIVMITAGHNTDPTLGKPELNHR